MKGYGKTQKLSKNNGNNNYYVVTCKHCDHELIGRVKNMRTHLKKCSAYKDVHDHSEILMSFTQIEEKKSSSSSKRSIVSTVSSGITWKKLKKTQFMDRDLSAREVKLSNGILLEYVAACSVPFQSVEYPAFKAYIRPSAVRHLPSCRALGGKQLKDAATCLCNERVPTMRKIVITDGCVGNFIYNGYEDGLRRHILGSIVKTLSEWISYDKALGDKGGNILAQHEHNGVVTAILIEQAVERTSCNLGIPLNSIVTDDAGQCQRAKRILSLRFPNKYFGKCYAYQVNLIVKDVFKILRVHVLERAKALVTTYNRSTKWLVILGDQCKKLYGQTSSLQRIIDVRWNSTQASFASILQIRSALKMVDAAYGTAPDFPNSLQVSKAFLEELSEAEKIVQPLTKASLYMQRDFNTLADVINIFGIVYQSFGKISQHTELQGLLEKRWSQQEQPISFLAFMLHPKYTVLENDVPEAVNDEEDEDDGDGWTTIFDAIDRLDGEVYQDKCHFIDTAVNESLINEIKKMKHSDGKEHQEKYPYPDGNDKTFPLEKLKGIRVIKCSLSSLFPPHIEPYDKLAVDEITVS